MSITDPCYSSIIGLTRTNCECLGCDADDEISDSGLYIDELEPLNSQLITNRADCEKGDLCQIMRTAREEAVKTFKKDLIIELMRWNELARLPFKGSIGTLKYTNSLTLNKTYSGIRIMGADVRSGYLMIKNIRTIFEENGFFNVYIYNNIGDLVETVLVQSVANTLTSNDVDIELPLHYDFLDNVKYFIIYESAGRTPKNVDAGCEWDICKPCFTKYHKGWEAWLMVSSYTTNTLAFIDSSSTLTGNSTMNGLILDVELICKTEEVICKDAFDFDGNPYAMSAAFAIQYMSGIRLIESFLGDTEINRYVVANRETLVNFRAVFLENYQKEIQFLGEKLDINNNDCLQCLDKYGFSKQTIWT